jgi:hypothetical protein
MIGLLQRHKMIDTEKLSKLEKAAKPAPWYAWTDETADAEDICIMTIPVQEYIKRKNSVETYNKTLSEKEYDSKFIYENRDKYEVIGCSEWMRAEDADFDLIVEMRNQLPEMLEYIVWLERAVAGCGIARSTLPHFD